MSVKNLLMLLCAISAPLYLAAEDTGSSAQVRSNTVVAEINGTKLTLSDLERDHPTALFQARNTFYDAERKAVDTLIDQYILEQQAKKENLTVAQLLEKHVNSTIAKDPSEEALRVYYEGVDTNEPYEAVRGKIVDALRSRRIAKAKAAYVQSLRNQATVAVLLVPPRADISLKDTPVRGATEARVTLVEYADYECPYCQQIQPTLQKLEEEYKGKLAFAYKDDPLPMHANAEKAAEAAQCAGAQGKYWDYHDMLFAKKQLDVPSLKQFARDLKLDGNAFDKCLDSGEKTDLIGTDVVEAQWLGIQGTPTFFINGRVVSGGSYEALRAVVQEELGESPAKQIAKR